MASTRPQAELLRERTKAFALRILRLFRALPKTEEARILGRQILKSGTSVAANYRACQRARSKAEFIAKMGVVLEEADETLFWLELLVEGQMVTQESVNDLVSEANQLTRIFSASYRTAKSGRAEAVKSPDHPIARSPARLPDAKRFA